MMILYFIKETKEDKEKEIDPKLLFPLKEWLWSFLPGHSFKWDFEDEEEEDEVVPIHEDVRHLNVSSLQNL